MSALSCPNEGPSAPEGLPLQCYDAFRQLNPQITKKQSTTIRREYDEFIKNDNFLDFVKNEYYVGHLIFQILERRVVILQKCQNKTNQLIFDNRILCPSEWPLRTWIFDNRGVFVKNLRINQKWPKVKEMDWFCCSDRVPAVPLWQQLETKMEKSIFPPWYQRPPTLPSDFEPPPDPQSKQQLNDLIEMFSARWPGHSCVVQFFTQRKPSNCIQIFTRDAKLTLPTEQYNEFFEHNRTLSIYGHTDKDFKVRFHIIQGKINYKKTRFKADIDEKMQEKKKREESEKCLGKPEIPPDPLQSNRSSAVSVQLDGLNLAVQLGLLQSKELRSLSRQLADLTVILHGQFDSSIEKKHLRHLTVHSGGEDDAPDSFFFMEITCKDINLALQQWGQIFDYLERKLEKISERKRTILAPLMEYLDRWIVLLSPPPDVETKTQNRKRRKKRLLTSYSRCKAQLQAYIDQHKIFVLSLSDEILHAIKAPLLCFVNTRLKRSKNQVRSFQMKAVSGNNLSALTCPELAVINLGCYFDSTSHEELFSSFEGYKQFGHPFTISKCFKYLCACNKIQDPASGEETTVLHLCVSRGRFYTTAIAQLWIKLAEFFIKQFKFDVTCLPGFFSMPTLAFKSIWLKCDRQSGPFHQTLEKMKPFTEQMLRQYCRGGFSFSCGEKLAAGEPLWSGDAAFGHLRASSLMELDIVSSYGYAASTLSAPTGFCKGFIGSEHGLSTIDLRHRYTSFEFLSVFYTIWLAKFNWKFNIKSIFSNFHASGIFYVGPYPLDLAIVDNRGHVMLFNFDGQFCHGCPEGCPPLKRYASGKLQGKVEEDTRKRDEYIQKWVDAIRNQVDNQAASYTVIADCHDKDYHIDTLLVNFKFIAELAALIKPYRDIEKFARVLTSQDPIERRLTKCPDNVTYILVAQCGETENRVTGPGPSGPLFVCPFNEAENQTSRIYNRQMQTKGEREGVLLSKDYFSYLSSTRGDNFKVDKIQLCLLYPKWNAFNEVYKELVRMRNNPQICAVEKQLLKNLVNYSCGYFGLNQIAERVKPKLRLGNRISKKINFAKTMIFNYEEFDKQDYSVFYSCRPITKKAISGTPVPLYLSVVEIGKLRLIQILDWLEKCAAPGTFRHLYTNVDNLIVALSTPNLDALPLPQHADTFQFFKRQFMAPGPAGKPEPGGLKLEWSVGPETGWKFATCALQNWNVITDNVTDENENRTKSNFFPGVSAREAYEYATTLIDKGTVVLQQRRRINKMVNTDEHQVTFKFVPR
jgi:hypothetical protein